MASNPECTVVTVGAYAGPLPSPTAGLFLSAGAILAKRAIRAGGGGEKVTAYVRRAVEQEAAAQASAP